MLVAVDGRQPGYSTGLTNFELALTMMRLGCVTASALDAGGSTTMAFDGKLLNRPSDPGGERAVAEALTLFYYGVYEPALPARVLSPNADGVDDAQVVLVQARPAFDRHRVAARSRRRRRARSTPARKGPGLYKFNWTGAGQPEGAWTFRVDRGRRPRTSLDRGSAVRVSTTRSGSCGACKPRRFAAAFKLSRPARVALRVETPGGAHRQDACDAEPPGR